MTVKILGQVAPLATTETLLYTCPSATGTVISTIIVCNRGATPSTFRVSAAAGGGATASKDYIYFDIVLAGNDTFAATFGITLSATDKVQTYASTSNLSFSLFGEENPQ